MYIYIYIYLYIYAFIHTYTRKENKTNRMEFLFPQTSYNIRFKSIHVLNATPYAGDIISLFKGVSKRKLASKVSELNRLYFLLVLTFAISINIRASY